MRIAAAALVCGLLVTSAHAHDRGESSPWSERDGWVHVGTDREKGDVTYVAVDHLLRAGDAVFVETLRVEASVDERFGTNQAHYHMLLDCSDGTWTRISYRGYRPDGTGSRLLDRPLGEREPLDQTSVLGRAFAIACMDATEGLERIADPVAHAAGMIEE